MSHPQPFNRDSKEYPAMRPAMRKPYALVVLALIVLVLAGYAASDAISSALGITVSVHASEPAEPAEEPVASGQAWQAARSRAARPIVPSLAELEASIPEFLNDDDPTSVQLAQMRIYQEANSPEEVWRRHMAPLLASAEEMASVDSMNADDEASLEAFRDQLDDFMVDMDSLIASMPQDRVMDYPQRIVQAREVVATASLEQLAQLKGSYDRFPGFLNTPAYVQGILEEAEEAPGAAGGRVLPGVPLPSLPALPNVVIPVPEDPEVPKHPNCRIYGGKGLADVGTCSGCPTPPAGGLATIFALETAAGIAEEACEYVPENIHVIAVDIPNPFKWLCIAIRMGLQIAAASVKFTNDLNGECEQAYHLGIQHAYLDAEVSKVTTQKSHDFHAAYSLRIAIENDLLAEGLDRISLFQLPRSQGGYLDAQDDISVRYIVRDTIGMAQAAGYDVRNAQLEYDAAEAHYGAGDYKQAYDRYRRAYRTAVRVGREP